MSVNKQNSLAGKKSKDFYFNFKEQKKKRRNIKNRKSL